MQNREIFLVDPTTATLPNEGVAKVLNPQTPEEWQVLRYELRAFVCEGEYARGLERILSSYLAHLSQPSQPAAWVSGFYGSGKSHLVRMLEYLWRDMEFPDGAHARDLAKLPRGIADLLVELSTAGKREGGLWSAAGTLGAGSGADVRLRLLGVVFQSAGLPEQYAPARLALWLKQNELYAAVKAGVEGAGKDFTKEILHLYVSPHLARSLLATRPDFASSESEARSHFKAQFPNRTDISDEEFLQTLDDVLALQSATPGKMPCTLLVFDELQQFIGDDAGRSLQVQQIVEACSTRFGSRLLFVATGQSALQATPQLSRLQGRFTVQVTLSDQDVERVVREVVLRKKPAAEPVLKAMLQAASGEIDRQLAGTRIGPTPGDREDLVPDYPLLPVRRRFWERVLRGVDPSGTAGQLRTQLRVVHEAAQEVAEQPLGTVVAGDRIYGQLRNAMLNTGALLPEIAAVIDQQRDGSPDGSLRARLCAAVFLIAKLPTGGPAATGVRATAGALADLLITDLTSGSAELRHRVPELLQELVDNGTLMRVDDEYRMQTKISREWDQEYKRNFNRIRADESRIASDRADVLKTAVQTALRGLSFTQGVNKTPRKMNLHFGNDAPPESGSEVPVWARDEWSATEKAVRDDALAAGDYSPLVFVFLPRRSPDALRTTLASRAAAEATIQLQPRPATAEGQEALAAMQSRVGIETGQLEKLVAEVLAGAKVFQAGGREVEGASLAASVRVAVENALERLFPRFALTDVPGWGKVVQRASEGAPDALEAIGYHGDVKDQPACREIRAFAGEAGKRGAEIRKRFTGPPYGWPQDAVDGALLALVASGAMRAARNGQPLRVKDIAQSQIGVIDFISEGAIVSAGQRLAIRLMLSQMGLPCNPGEEAVLLPRALARLAELAQAAGGEPPAPERPATTGLEELRVLTGNEQLLAAFERKDRLAQWYAEWTQRRDQIEARQERWQTLGRLLRQAEHLPEAAEVKAQAEAIRAGRMLLAEPDPLPPLINQLADALRLAVQSARHRVVEARAAALASLESSAEWSQVPEAERRRILQTNGLGTVPEVQVGTVAALLTALETTSLAAWEVRAAAIPQQAAQAREQLIRLAQPKVQAARVHPRPATLRTEQEVDEYLAGLRAEIMDHVRAGRPVIL